MRVAVLGAGPSGYMAAWGALQCGSYVEMFSDAYIQRQNYGVFFLHNKCDLPLDATVIMQKIVGNKGMTPDEAASSYGRFVYGNENEGWGIKLALNEPEIVGYDPNIAMALLSEIMLYIPKHIYTVNCLNDVTSLLSKFDKIICTIPASSVFPDKKYPEIDVWITWDYEKYKTNFFYTNVNPILGWHRLASVFGRFSGEYMHPVPSSRMIKKVAGGMEVNYVHKDILFTGRYGAWDRKIRTEHVYTQTIDFLTQGR